MLQAQAESPHWAERCQAGVLLARHADNQAAHPALMRLLQDRLNTAVPADTALALLRRQDEHGVRLFALAYADDRTDPDVTWELSALLYDVEACDWKALRPVLERLTYGRDVAARAAAFVVLDKLGHGGR